MAITATQLERFEPVNALGAEQLAELASTAQVIKVATGTVLMERGTTDNWTVYLLEGRLTLEAADKAVLQIYAGAERSFSPIARLQPRQYRVVATSPCTIIRIANDQLQSVVSGQMIEGYDVNEDVEPSSDDFRIALGAQLQKDIEQDRLVLPSLPEVAMKIREQLQRKDCSLDHLASLIQTDPTIAAKVVKMANSALYTDSAPVKTCKAAIARLGTTATVQLVTTFTLQELFHSRSQLMGQWMRNLWEHSTSVAAISYVLARNIPPMFEPERAMLAGLLHDIGTVAILNYLNEFGGVPDATDEVDRTITQLRGKIGGMILTHWKLDTDVVTAAIECENWDRDPTPAPDLCDVVLMAQLHAFLLNPQRGATLPPIAKLPAFKKLGLASLDPGVGVRILNEAREQVAEVKRFLSI